MRVGHPSTRSHKQQRTPSAPRSPGLPSSGFHTESKISQFEAVVGNLVDRILSLTDRVEQLTRSLAPRTSVATPAKSYSVAAQSRNPITSSPSHPIGGMSVPAMNIVSEPQHSNPEESKAQSASSSSASLLIAPNASSAEHPSDDLDDSPCLPDNLLVSLKGILNDALAPFKKAISAHRKAVSALAKAKAGIPSSLRIRSHLSLPESCAKFVNDEKTLADKFQKDLYDILIQARTLEVSRAEEAKTSALKTAKMDFSCQCEQLAKNCYPDSSSDRELVSAVAGTMFAEATSEKTVAQTLKDEQVFQGIKQFRDEALRSKKILAKESKKMDLAAQRSEPSLEELVVKVVKRVVSSQKQAPGKPPQIRRPKPVSSNQDVQKNRRAPPRKMGGQKASTAILPPATDGEEAWQLVKSRKPLNKGMRKPFMNSGKRPSRGSKKE